MTKSAISEWGWIEETTQIKIWYGNPSDDDGGDRIQICV